MIVVTQQSYCDIDHHSGEHANQFGGPTCHYYGRMSASSGIAHDSGEHIRNGGWLARNVDKHYTNYVARARE